MLKISNIEVYGLIKAIKYARISYDNLIKSDSTENKLGEKDKELALKLCKAGSSHRKFMRQIHIHAYVEAPWKWWKEYVTYKVGTTENSSSMMHTLTNKILTEEDFCWENTTNLRLKSMQLTNKAIQKYRKTKNYKDWEELMDIVPGGFKYKRYIDLNYEVLSNIVSQRNNHKMKEWHDFIEYMKKIPYYELIEISNNINK